jgi:hypothetical protein
MILDTSPLATDFTAKHELFHVMQYASLEAGVLATGITSWPRGTQETIRSWMEGSAEWAADFSETNDWSDPSSTNQLDEFLYRTDDFIFDFVESLPFLPPSPENQEQYGSFIFAESIEQAHGAAKIGDIWTAFEGQGVVPAGDVITSQIANYPDHHADFWSDVYIMEETDPGGLGFANGNELRAEFGDRPGTQNLAGQPHGTSIQIGQSIDFEYADGLLPGGAVVFELELPPGTPGTLQIDIDEHQTDVEYRLVAVDNYPNTCAGASEEYMVLGAGVDEWTTDGSCDVAAVVATYTDITGDGLEPGGLFGLFLKAGPRRMPGFTVSMQPSAGPATNLDFETGDLSGWTIVDSGDPGTVYDVSSPGLAGTDNAFHLVSSGQPIDGIQQSIEWQFANCAVSAIAVGGAGTTVRLTVLDASDGSTWGVHEYTFTGNEGAPVPLFVSGPTFYLPDVYTIQLLYVASSGAVDAMFDEVEIGNCI